MNVKFCLHHPVIHHYWLAECIVSIFQACTWISSLCVSHCGSYLTDAIFCLDSVLFPHILGPEAPADSHASRKMKMTALFYVTWPPHSTFSSNSEHLISLGLKKDFRRPLVPLLHPFPFCSSLYTGFYWHASLRHGQPKPLVFTGSGLSGWERCQSILMESIWFYRLWDC